MIKNEYILQNDFSKGMILIKGDMVPEQNPNAINSVLWLQNYNPNIEQGSLVRRFNYIPYHPSSSKRFIDLGLRYNVTIPTDIISMGEITTVDPISSKVFFIMRKDVIPCNNPNTTPSNANLEGSRITAYYPIENPNNTVPEYEWVDPTIDKFTNSRLDNVTGTLLKNNGINILGTIRDYTNFGQQLLIVSNFNVDMAQANRVFDHNNYAPVYPVYIWYFDDMRNLTNYLNLPTTTFNYRDNQKWKIKGRYGKLDKINNPRQVDILLPITNETNVVGGLVNNIYSRIEGGIGSSTTSNLSTLVENRLFNANSFDFLDVLFWQSANLPDLTTRESKTIGTLEVPRVTDNQYFDLWTYLHCTASPPYHYKPNIRLHNFTYKDGRQCTHAIAHSIDWGGKIMGTANWSNSGTTQPDNYTYSSWAGNIEKASPVHLFRMEQYLVSKTPRKWMKDERIPYILTAVIDGIETVIKKDVYIVKGGNTYSYSSDSLLYNTSAITLEVNTSGIKRYKTFAANTLRHIPRIDNFIYRAYKFDMQRNIDYTDMPQLTADGLTFVPKYYKDDNLPDPNSENIRYDEEYLESTMPYIFFTLRFNVKDISDIWNILPDGITEFKLYISEPNADKKVINQFWSRSTDEFEYCLPLADPTEYTSVEYRLIKVFPIRDKGYNPDRNVLRLMEHNYVGTIGLSHGKFINFNINPTLYNAFGDVCRTNFEGEGVYFVPNDYNLTNFNPNVSNSNGDPWTGDFCIWDYNLTGPSLYDNVGDLLSEWDGRGARTVDNMKGITLIGGCIDNKYKEEIGRVRHSYVKDGNYSRDAFAEIDFFDISKNSITAIRTFREQVFVFTEKEVTRMQVPDILDEFKWEVLEAWEGQGTYSVNTVCKAPSGMYWCNQSGIWHSDGREPQNISLSILELYYALMFDNSYKNYGITSYDTIINYDKTCTIDYDTTLDEVIVNFIKFYDGKKCSFRLIYNVVGTNWRIETITLDNRHLLHSFIHRVNWYTDKSYMGLLVNNNQNSICQNISIKDRGNFDLDQHLVDINVTKSYPVIAKVKLYDFGNGIDDNVMNRVIVEQSHRIYSSIKLPDTQLLMTLNPNLHKYQTIVPSIDLAKLNDNQDPSQNIFNSTLDTPSPAMTSLIFNSPMSQFRRCNLEYISCNSIIIRSISCQFSTLMRKTYG